MAVPATTARSTPLGIMLDDGYSCKIACALDPDISFWEKTVSPPGLDGEDALSITTMHNTAYRTFAPRSLITLPEMTCTCGYDPDVYDEIIAIINTNTSWTVHFPDTSTLDFFGYLKTFDVADLSEGGEVEATVTIVPTNYDSANNVEQGPVMTEAAGT